MAAEDEDGFLRSGRGVELDAHADGDILRGQSEEGDGETFKMSLIHGSDFADGRGHLLLAGELTEDDGVTGTHRSWADRENWQVMANPAYTTANGLPKYIIAPNVGPGNGTYGGLSYVIRPGTTLIGQIAHTDNHSNVEIDKFRRTLATLSLRFNF